jgi:hypothetical protein
MFVKIFFQLVKTGLKVYLEALSCRTGLAGSQGVLETNKKNSVRTETNRNKICFGLFRETETKKIRFVSVFRTYVETTETYITVSKHRNSYIVK